jgi:hypothetical protein
MIFLSFCRLRVLVVLEVDEERRVLILWFARC